jgi:hypothetical protein
MRRAMFSQPYQGKLGQTQHTGRTYSPFGSHLASQAQPSRTAPIVTKTDPSGATDSSNEKKIVLERIETSR